MLENMRRLHPRGTGNRGICVDAEGAMLGPDCVLVDRTSRGFRGVQRDEASIIQKCVFDAYRDPDWLFAQCERIAEALDKGEVALAQIYGLRIPIGDLSDRQLRRIALTRLAKAAFNPDEPRVPKGDLHGGEWTNDAGSAVGPDGTVATLDAVTARDVPSAAAGGPGGADSSSPPMEYSIAPGGSDTSSDRTPATPEIPSGSVESNTPESPTANSPSAVSPIDQVVPAAVAFVRDESQSLLGKLLPITLEALEKLLARVTVPTIVFRILFIPSNRSSVIEGPIAGSPDLSYRYDGETGVLQIRQNLGSLGPVVITEAHTGTDGLLREEDDQVVGRVLSNGVIVDPDSLAGYHPLDEDDPKLCPDPGPDQPGAPKDNPYQRYISTLVNGWPLLPGLAVNLWNPVDRKIVHFDDCRLSDGTMIEAKGPGYLRNLQKGDEDFVWGEIRRKTLRQADLQSKAAQGRPIEWHFAEREVADYFRVRFQRLRLPITVIHTPWPEVRR